MNPQNHKYSPNHTEVLSGIALIDWSDRSNGVPEYVIRTGSKKSTDIKEEHNDIYGNCLFLPISNYASYVLQTGCFTWTGR
jgi:hypothetical protein